MAFESKWLDWGKNPTSACNNPENSSVSSVSSLNIEIHQKKELIINKESLLTTPRCQNSEISTDLCIQRTDKTDKTREMDGHVVHRVIWETDKAVVFQDERGRFWRYLHAYRQAWPVVVGGSK
jgi:hypothetical protein